MYFSSAQKTSSTIKFSEVWVWEYVNIDGKKGEMAIYREPKLNYWLITPDDADFVNKMNEFMVSCETKWGSFASISRCRAFFKTNHKASVATFG
ncbi:MAG: hypothetical protein R2779_09795 [Crocinitomicaceae bacterium]